MSKIKSVKKQVKPTEPIKTVEIPVENIQPVKPEVVIEPEKVKSIADHELFDMLLSDIKKAMPSEEEKRRMKQQLNHVCPESRDLLTTIVKILSRF